MIDLKRVDEYFSSKECDDYFLKLNNLLETNKRHLEKFHSFQNKSEIIDKIIEKYNSQNYIDKWFDNGFEPPETLYWFLFSYAEKYGREANDDEYEMYSNNFTTKIYYCCSYVFCRQDGQGSYITIYKVETRKLLKSEIIEKLDNSILDIKEIINMIYGVDVKFNEKHLFYKEDVDELLEIRIRLKILKNKLSK